MSHFDFALRPSRCDAAQQASLIFTAQAGIADSMRLNDEEKAMAVGESGRVRQWAIRHQIAVGDFFDAEDFVPVTQAHVMSDTEALGETGLKFLEDLGTASVADRSVMIPTITDPRSVDLEGYRRIHQKPWMADFARRANAALSALGVLLTDTCINYQIIMPPIKGEHLAMGDTGVVAYMNGVMGARSNFEGGPSALAAGLTGRTPRYGYHLASQRKGTHHFAVSWQPRSPVDWGVLGGIVGRHVNGYWGVPVISGIEQPPTSDEMKQLAAALGSYGSLAMFHVVGITPEALTAEQAFDGASPAPKQIARTDFDDFRRQFEAPGEKVDVVVFSAPQLSLMEILDLSERLAGRKVHSDTALIITTAPDVKSAADRLGLTAKVEQSGAILLAGVCFYQMHAREIAEANGWKRLMTNSAKLVNILGGYGYDTVLSTTERCVESAVQGRVV
jgi:predicted aconitase